LDREALIARLNELLSPLPFVRAAWIAGSEAFGEADVWSDVDLNVDASRGHVEDVFGAVESALDIAAIWRVPEPTWHGHRQRFYRLRDASAFLLLDLAIMEEGSTSPRFDEKEIHGTPRILFDKAGVASVRSLDQASHEAKLRARFETLRARTAVFDDVLVQKELARGHDLDALVFYLRFVVDPLIELLRMKHRPARYDWGPRYLFRDLPPELVSEVTSLYFVRDLADLREKLPRAMAMLREQLA
ncbi:MAG: nucleotidyltransferase domain-containing protein, partial [Polyangiales bacterium]